jgi:hypothetical protein
MAGYTLVTAGGGIAASEVYSEASGENFDRADPQLPIGSTLHALHATVGWRWVLREHLLLRAGIGWVHTVHSRTDIGPDRNRRRDGPADRAIEAAERYMDDQVLQTYGFSPVVRVMAGYRF